MYLRFFQLPFIPIDPAQGDQADFLWGATNVLAGKVIYRDFVQFTTPGTEYFYALLIRTFGQTAVLPKAVCWVVGVAFTWLGVKLSRLLLTGWEVYVPTLLFLTAGFIPTQDPTHHVFSTLAALGAVLVLSAEPPTSGRTAFAGLLTGLSSCFTPTRGATVTCAFFIYLWLNKTGRQRWKLVSTLLSAYALTVVILLTPVIWRAGLSAAIQNLVVYPLHSYRLEPWNNMGAYMSDVPSITLSWKHFIENAISSRALVRWGLIYALVPWIYVFAGVRILRRPIDDECKRRLQLVCVTGIALFLSIAYAPTFFRLGIISLPAMVLLIWMLGESRKFSSSVITALLAAFAVVTLPAGIIHSQRDNVILNTPSGRMALSRAVAEKSADKYRFLGSHTQPGDYFFSVSHLEFDYLYRLRHSSPVASMSVYPYTTDGDVERTIEQLERERPEYVFWPVDAQAVTANTEQVLGTEDHLRPLRAYLGQRYQRVKTFSDFEEVWQRKAR